jgi:nitroimidazol reductase NimA-like FMN-containing flavoprotein (pyridoxamine 5'-phosphate oxidase superfamily)
MSWLYRHAVVPTAASVEEAELSDDSAVVLEEIPREECLELLSRAAVGRLGVVDGRQPVVVPVNFAYTPDGIVVRTDVGTKLEAGTQHLVALEIDEIDPVTHLGWSVLVKGHAFDVTDALDHRSERLQAAVVETWAPGPKARRLLVDPTTVTGRRLRQGSVGTGS